MVRLIIYYKSDTILEYTTPPFTASNKSYNIFDEDGMAEDLYIIIILGAIRRSFKV